MNRILITGSNGYIGKSLVANLQSKYELTGIDINKTCSNNTINYLQCDIADYEDLYLKLNKYEFDYIIHCAAIAHNDDGKFKDEDFYRVNAVGTKNLIDYSENTNIKKFIFFSTIDVYGKIDSCDEITEETVTQPLSVYGKSKLAAEKYLCTKRNIPFVIIRLAPVYSSELLKDVRKRILLTSFLGLYLIFQIGNGRQKYSFVSLENVLRIIGHIIDDEEFPKYEIFNIRDVRYCTQLEIIGYFANVELKSLRTLRIWIPRFLLKILLFMLGSVLKSKKLQYDSVFRKLADDNLYSMDKIQNTSFKFDSESLFIHNN